MSKIKDNLKERKGTLLLTILVAVCFPLILCVSVPFEIYANNLQEFKFSLGDFFPICLAISLLCSLVLFVLMNLLPNRARRILIYFFLALELMCFVQGTYLNGNMNSLSGDNLASSGVSKASSVINFVVWLLIAVSFVVLAIFADKKGFVKLGCSVLVVIVLATQLIGMFSISISKKNVFEDKKKTKSQDGITRAISTKDLTTVSSSNNIYYFVVDRFDEIYAESAFDKDNSVYDSLKGFTWYKDNLSLYGHTFPGIASLLTNREYNEDDTRQEFLDKVYDGETPLKVLSDNGYKVNLYTQEYYAYNAQDLPDYIANHEEGYFEVENKFMLSIRMIQMALYRCLPMMFKNLTGAFGTQIFEDFIKFNGDSGNVNYKTDNRTLWNFVNDNEFVETTDKQFSFIHMEGCHNVDYNDSWEKASEEESKDITYSVRNSFKIINKYLDVLKEKGLYKNATIVITGDHARPINDFGALDSSIVTALFFKPSGLETDDLKTSKAPVAQTNIWKSIMNSEEISCELDLEKSLEEIDEAEVITRKITWHTYERGKMTAFKYQVTGEASNFDNWKLVSDNKYNHGIMV